MMLKTVLYVSTIVTCFMVIGYLEEQRLQVEEGMRQEQPVKHAGRVPFIKPDCPYGWIAHKADNGDWYTACTEKIREIKAEK